MHPRNVKFTSALLLSAALTLSLSACEPDKANSSGKSGSSASASKDGSKDQGSSGQGGKGSGDGTGKKGTFDNSRPVALPIPFAAGPTSAVSEDKTLAVTFQPEKGGAVTKAINAYEQQLQKNGYESSGDGWTRGKQRLDMENEADGFQVAITYPDAAPPLPAAPLQGVTSSEDDTLKLTYGLDKDSDNSVSMAKGYAADLTDKGWQVPEDGGTTATKGSSQIKFDTTDPKQITITVDIPSSTS